MTTVPWRVIAMLGGIILLIVVLGLGLRACQQNHSLKTQNKVATGQVGASTASGAAAVNTVGGVMSNDASTDAAVAQGQASISAAPEGQKGAATIAAACRLRAYRDTPQCKEHVK